MKSLLTLHLSALRSVAQHCSIGIDLDIAYVKNRWEEEGDSFLTISLPKFAKALETGLSEGFWPGHMSTGFQRHGHLPAFLRGFVSRIFHKSGRLLDRPDTDCIWAVRQFCYLTHKVEMECSPARVSAAFQQFIQTDDELLGLPGRLDQERVNKFCATAQRLFGDLFGHLDVTIRDYALIPKHGPGSVAESISPREKRDYAYWTERLESVFPYWRYTRNSEWPQSQPVLVPIDQEMPVRVISVPKTMSTPRIIAIEPSSIQYAQQGLKREIYQWIDSRTIGKVLGFRDQDRNQALAQKASVDQSLATLDLSEASDRVHWYLVRLMFKHHPHLWEFVWNTRTHRAKLPGGLVKPLQKFASMGSALTFPLEAMVFTTLALCGMEDGRKTRHKIRDLPGLLSVYGDDIIVPTTTVDRVVDWLEHFGAKVNRAKSFWSGHFRESCGAEYYNGTDVSVVRLRHELPSSRDDAVGVASLVDFRNRAYRAGLWRLVADIDQELEDLIRLPLSRVSQEDSSDRLDLSRESYLQKETFLSYPVKHVRYNPHLQRYERRVPVFIPKARSYRVEEEAGLLEWFHSSLRRGDFVNRYDSQERPTSFSIKRRWTAIQAG